MKIIEVLISLFIITINIIHNTFFFLFFLIEFSLIKKIKPAKVSLPVKSIWYNHQLQWHRWILTTNYYRKYNQEVKNIDLCHKKYITDETKNEKFICNIIEITGIQSSKDNGNEVENLTDFALRYCKNLISKENPKNMYYNLNWEYYNNIKEYYKLDWSNDIFWMNSGGSHHFSAARYLSMKLNIPITLYGSLSTFAINPELVSILNKRWDLFIFQKNQLSTHSLKALELFNCSYGLMDVPEGLISIDKKRLEILVLDKKEIIPNLVGKYLSLLGFTRVGDIIPS